MTQPARRRTVTVTDETAPSIVVPRGRSAAEQRLGAIAALHQPVLEDHGAYNAVLGRRYICPACSNRYDTVRWPCAHARLLGPWPGELPE